MSIRPAKGEYLIDLVFNAHVCSIIPSAFQVVRVWFDANRAAANHLMQLLCSQKVK